MKRWAVRIFVFVLLGAIINLAVARTATNLRGPHWHMCAKLMDGGNVNKSWFGWPTRCMYTQRVIGPSASLYTPPVIMGIEVGWHPIWPGLAINTVFYAVIVWLLFALGATPFSLRKHWRIKRGLCAKCAYDLRGSTAALCPECGATK